ncbi:MAG: 1-deoxy-D-xylulose-5-phosphate reductoisomerase, partial [Bacilli bacterium]|nr:1-deoxy-D-xylulose-5-phosphate reductoisomerase [Bacilli bacterium]
MTNIFLLGSTGSIGRQTLEIIASEPSNFRVKTLSCRKRIDILKGQIEKFKPEMVAVAYDQDKAALEKEFPIVKFVSGKAGLIEAATYGQTCDQDLVVNALVGVSGLEPTIAALASG